MTKPSPSLRQIKDRFRKFFPVIVDVETGGFNSATDALLEVAAVTLQLDEQGFLHPNPALHYHIEPFSGSNIEQSALEFTGIDPYHPFRMAVSEHKALQNLFQQIHIQMKATLCQRAILVGHNAHFDLSFIQAASERCDAKPNPFHRFSVLDTVSLSALVYGETVLARALRAAGLGYNSTEAHSALYDAESTAKLFCAIANNWQSLNLNSAVTPYYEER